MEHQFNLVSFKLCPYVQRAVIVLLEKGIPYQRTDIELSNKPDWFNKLSPTGKVPLLHIDNEHIIFESAVICEYLDEVTPNSLFGDTPLKRAKQRSWIEFGTSILQLIAQLYSAKTQADYTHTKAEIWKRFQRMEKEISGPYFDGDSFGMVDAVFAPIFRYFDVFENETGQTFFEDLPNVSTWRRFLKTRPSVYNAVSTDYANDLRAFVIKRKSYLSTLFNV
jgi:glutathione S-transferase